MWCGLLWCVVACGGKLWLVVDWVWLVVACCSWWWVVVVVVMSRVQVFGPAIVVCGAYVGVAQGVVVGVLDGSASCSCC